VPTIIDGSEKTAELAKDAEKKPFAISAIFAVFSES
jgi:hypothetical protein